MPRALSYTTPEHISFFRDDSRLNGVAFEPCGKEVCVTFPCAISQRAVFLDRASAGRLH